MNNIIDYSAHRTTKSADPTISPPQARKEPNGNVAKQIQFYRTGWLVSLIALWRSSVGNYKKRSLVELSRSTMKDAQTALMASTAEQWQTIDINVVDS